MNLASATIKKTLVIESILDSELEIKLLELGFSIGSKVEVLRMAPARGPLTLKNNKAQIILRLEDAKLIAIREFIEE